MKKYFIAIFLMFWGSLSMWPLAALAGTPTPQNQIIFSEIFPGNPSPNASQEFIELYNNSDTNIDVSGWHVQYASATKTDWSSPSRNITLSGIIKAGEYYLLASSGYLTDKSDLSFSATLAQTGGHLRILDRSGNMQDLIGWGNAAMPLGTAVTAPDPGSSIARDTSASGFNTTGDNSTDFANSLTPTQKADNVITLPPDETSPPDGTPPDPSTSPPVTKAYADVIISELMPNPASPQTDSQDEYVELYNPNKFDVDLNGYILQTGLKSTYKYNIKDKTIAAGGYSVFYSRDTNLTLSNTSGKATLLDPDGKLVDETAAYSSAAPGEAWILADGKWVWTTSPTPGADNIFVAPALATTLSVNNTKKAVPKTTKVKATSTTKKAATKTSKAKKTSKKTAKSAGTASANTNKPTKPAAKGLHPMVLAGVGSLAVLYAGYEYRQDLANQLHRLRRYREARRAAGQNHQRT